ncbi:inositol monophosphatase [Sphingomonas sp. ABOLE]|uniref:inositol monophosphatase family protein n=1 Tax=Sphingomonas sp. ABOLE TaxID=1985878 RepID=UPI000F7F8164|nr:inositol monophosphatase family protein [Sphingomonas sp. ABOLE]RSV43213.1 inositol monophosphatase [Sphingomonas sp. ABOLE]
MHPHHDAVSALIRRVAETVVLPRFRNLAAHEVLEKTPGELVTIADREAEERLTEGLAAIAPDAVIIGEEACAANPALVDQAMAARAWVIDPIDGTGNFAAGEPPFGIMIALIEAGVIQAGWIYDPVAERMCHAALGGGAFVNGTQVQARQSDGPRPHAAVSKVAQSEAEHAERMRRFEQDFELWAMPRCAAENYPRLALGQNDVAVFRRTLIWDHAPGVVFLGEAGGYVAHWNGTPYRVDGKGVGLIAASTPELGRRATELLFG